MSEYSAERVRGVGLPEAVRRGQWWVHSWTLTAPADMSLLGFVSPAPLLPLEGAFVSTWFSDERVILSVFGEVEMITVPALVYASQIASEINRLLDGVDLLIDGIEGHQLLGMVCRADIK
ncbi:hypothetical protein [Actinomadura roseirufa]|uniref:hypothetical protein n=1 Tax=Actinomadura roseirufa TaxID=2094049 RepID=UPI0010417615|nr:hypothetical protein [Actinomadura roseirufa]